MLVLTRQVGEVIIVGENVRVEVVQIRGNKVCIGIDAPKEVPVHRLEVYEAIHGGPKRIEPLPGQATFLK